MRERRRLGSGSEIPLFGDPAVEDARRAFHQRRCRGPCRSGGASFAVRGSLGGHVNARSIRSYCSCQAGKGYILEGVSSPFLVPSLCLMTLLWTKTVMVVLSTSGMAGRVATRIALVRVHTRMVGSLLIRRKPWAETTR